VNGRESKLKFENILKQRKREKEFKAVFLLITLRVSGSVFVGRVLADEANEMSQTISPRRGRK